MVDLQKLWTAINGASRLSIELLEEQLKHMKMLYDSNTKTLPALRVCFNTILVETSTGTSPETNVLEIHELCRTGNATLEKIKELNKEVSDKLFE